MDNRWRNDFPILDREIYEKKLVYLDNAATSQMPQAVLDRIVKHYTTEHANIHRGVHYLSEVSTSAVEEAREKVAAFLHAPNKDTIIFTQGTTDSVHLVSGGIAHRLSQGKGIISTELEHHSNYVPWQQLCSRTGADFYVCHARDGELNLMEMERLLKNHSIELVAVTQVSNLTGTVNPVREIAGMAHRYGAEILVDGAQGVLHQGMDVAETDCDYYVFSGHKMLAPTGIGVLYGKRECLEELRPVRFGGGMVDIVKKEETTFDPLPFRLEAGTPNISGIIALGSAVDYLQTHDPEAIRTYETNLLAYAEEKISALEHIHILGHPAKRLGVISFVADHAHPYDIASMVDKLGFAVRSGNHCAQPALRSLNVDKAVRVSPLFYNTREEIDAFCEALSRVVTMLEKYAQ